MHSASASAPVRSEPRPGWMRVIVGTIGSVSNLAVLCILQYVCQRNFPSSRHHVENDWCGPRQIRGFFCPVSNGLPVISKSKFPRCGGGGGLPVFFPGPHMWTTHCTP